MDTLPAPTSSPPPVNSEPQDGAKKKNGQNYAKSYRRKWPAGSLQQWTLPVLHQLAKHFPVAVNRIGEICADPEHKDNFNACKLVIETLIRDGKHRPALDQGGLTIKIEMTNGKKPEEKVIEHEPA